MNFEKLFREGRNLINKNNYSDAIRKFDESLALSNRTPDKQTRIDEQTRSHLWLALCYFERSQQAQNIEQAQNLLERARQYYKKNLPLIGQVNDEQKRTLKTIFINHGLGLCCLEQAQRQNNAEQLNEAHQYFKTNLELVSNISDPKKQIQIGIYVHNQLGKYHFQEAEQSKIAEEAQEQCKQAAQHFEKARRLASKLSDKQLSIEEQASAYSWLGQCCLKQMQKSVSTKQTKGPGDKARQSVETDLNPAAKLSDAQKELRSEVSTNTSRGLPTHQLEPPQKSKAPNQDPLSRALKYFESSQRLIKKIDNKGNKPAIKNDHLIREIFFRTKKYEDYLSMKTQAIIESINETNTTNDLTEKDAIDDLKKIISSILAVLNIHPIELKRKALAHYTNPHVCRILLGLAFQDHTPSKSGDFIRLNSSTYMNDPSEGKSLLDLLDEHEPELDNKKDFSASSAFFTCLSSRVNDLNQFRLYGKEDSVEASGCCIVFDTTGSWLKDADFSSFFSETVSISSSEVKQEEYEHIRFSNKKIPTYLPLYQIAYIAHKDEFFNENECDFSPDINDKKFAIKLKPIGEDDNWHELRCRKLKENLEKLKTYLEESKYLLKDMPEETKEKYSIETKKALEYIRYLFKDFAFRDEEEFRILKVADIKSPNVHHCEATNSIYMDYRDISPIVSEVILGTNYEKTTAGNKVEVFRHKLSKVHPHIKVSHSTLPINANPPLKKS